MNKWSRINYLPNLPLYEGKERVTESKAHIELSKNAAKEGMVLLKNEDKILPLAQGIDDREHGYDDSQERRELEKSAKILFG